MIRTGRGSGFIAGLAIALNVYAGLSTAEGQAVPPAVWADANSALRETQQGGRPTIIVALSATGTASDKLRTSLPAMIGRSYQIVEVDSEDQRDWMRQIGITGVPGIAVFAATDSGMKLVGTRSGVAEPAMILGWINGILRVGAAAPASVDSRVVRTSYQQASPQNPTPQYTHPAPTMPTICPPVYTPTPVYAPAPVYYAPAPQAYYGPAPGAAPVFTNPAPAPMSVSPSAAPIMVNPPQTTIVIGPQPAPNVVSAAPTAPAPSQPPQMFLAAPAPPAPAPMQMVAMAPAPAPAPMQMVAMAPAPSPVQMVAAAPQMVAAAQTSLTAQFVASAPAQPAAASGSMVVSVKPQRLRNRIGTSIGQFLIEKNKQKFDLVQTASLAAAPGLAPATTFSIAAPAGAPQAYCPPAPVADYASEPLPPLPSSQSGDCGACRKGNCLRHRHGK